MSHQLDKAYDPQKYESKLYTKWEDASAFTTDGNAHLRVASKEMPTEQAGVGSDS
ncbi:hypothetical protein IPG36_02105 [bacterium]|nr:MAG: hypothetical protein IPG36_02105 [bacterium]